MISRKNYSSLVQCAFASVFGSFSANPVEGASSASDPYVLNDGILMIEVESVEPATGWTFSTDKPDFLGDGYFEWTGPNYFGTPGNGLMIHHFEIQEPGYYQFWMRSFNLVGIDPREHNDIWVQIPTAQVSPSGFELPERPVKVFQQDLDRWTWETTVEQGTNYPFRVYLDAGVHEIHVSGRSQGFAIDRLMLFQYRFHRMREPDADNLPASFLKSEAPAYFTAEAEVVDKQVRLSLDASPSVAMDDADPITGYSWSIDGKPAGEGMAVELFFPPGGSVLIDLETTTESGVSHVMSRRFKFPLIPFVTALVDQPEERIFWEVYSGRFNSMPNLNLRVPVNQGWGDRLDFDRFTERTGAFRFIGYLEIQEAGNYRFDSRTDGGIRVWIGEQIILNNTGIALHEETFTDVFLEVGYYRVKVDFHLAPFENGFRLRFTGLDEGSQVFGIPDFVYHREESHPWIDSYYLGDGWYYSTWFGSFYPDPGTDWVYTTQAGWMYVLGTDPANVWFWTQEQGFAWTNKSFFPFIYLADSSSWVLWENM